MADDRSFSKIIVKDGVEYLLRDKTVAEDVEELLFRVYTLEKSLKTLYERINSDSEPGKGEEKGFGIVQRLEALEFVVNHHKWEHAQNTKNFITIAERFEAIEKKLSLNEEHFKMLDEDDSENLAVLNRLLAFVKENDEKVKAFDKRLNPIEQCMISKVDAGSNHA